MHITTVMPARQLGHPLSVHSFQFHRSVRDHNYWIAPRRNLRVVPPQTYYTCTYLNSHQSSGLLCDLLSVDADSEFLTPLTCSHCRCWRLLFRVLAAAVICLSEASMCELIIAHGMAHRQQKLDATASTAIKSWNTIWCACPTPWLVI